MIAIRHGAAGDLLRDFIRAGCNTGSDPSQWAVNKMGCEQNVR